ncbi:hypothetical protein DL89DRAFT_111766 [Linderina pennispora]|uniref:Uncharacterized protein n=1 Tax=Linderina pennispora TaxID=61395 RepID=A0A1Y1WFM5_9FUNG|nr:uncharacterized protein DL89DRAFT_111766 [Linderina pennispora]ORX72309.1 hypothetical protein DL89DRAFT_111766 [Linderina pennispora]
MHIHADTRVDLSTYLLQQLVLLNPVVVHVESDKQRAGDYTKLLFQLRLSITAVSRTERSQSFCLSKGRSGCLSHSRWWVFLLPVVANSAVETDFCITS